MTFLYGVTVTRQRAGAKPDPYSGLDTQDDWDNPLSEDFEGCAVWSESSVETQGQGSEIRNQVVTVISVTLPYGADVKPKDRLLLPGGIKIEVQGEVEQWKHPMTGWEAGAVAKGLRIDG